MKKLGQLLRLIAIAAAMAECAPAFAANINVVWTRRSANSRRSGGPKKRSSLRSMATSLSDFYQGASLAAAALTSGDAQVGMFSPQVVITNPGLELVMFGRLGNTMDNRVYGKKGLKSIKEVKRIAISRFGSNADFAARFLLQREGLRPRRVASSNSAINERIAPSRTITPTPPCSRRR